MRKIILTLMVLGAGLSAIAQNTYGLNDSNARANKRQQAMSAWHKDMAEFRARSAQERQLNALADSLAYVQGKAALTNRDFVLQATSVTFKNPNGWWRASSSTATSGTSISSSSLSNTSTAATYLNSTYYSYYWKRS